ncbi:MAG: dTDP-4-dehydrorhamnose 3,5-epimerase [Psychroserpens sp.]|jgi:dTDP-4-dehydrorhamnose 3,5-epimerase
MVQLIRGVKLTKLAVIEQKKGNIYHALKKSEESFREFGEAYFSTVRKGDFKGWKQHQRMILNIVVPVGSIRFYFVGENLINNRQETASIELSPANYQRITVEPGVWVGFKGIEQGLNLLLNIASIPHDPSEAVNRDEDYWMHLFQS